MTTPLDVLVVGVANVDLVTQVAHLPGPGETVFGDSLSVLAGGKGLNQAVAVTRCGGTAALAATAGDDTWGHFLRRTLQHASVDTSSFRLIAGGTTAAALIQIPPGGDSAVTVTRTSTTLLSLVDLAMAQPLLESSAVTVIQLELDPAVVATALSLAGGWKIGMLVPLGPMPPTILSELDLIVVNASEAAALLGNSAPVASPNDVQATAEALRRLGPAAAVITLGSDGAAYSDQHDNGLVHARPTNSVDTTGAGDALLGALALTLGRGHSLEEAVRRGVIAGSNATTYYGANPASEQLLAGERPGRSVHTHLKGRRQAS